MEGPTLKCPFHQVDPHEVIDEEEIIELPEPKNGGKNTVMTELVDATLTYIHERPERFLMSSAERFLKQFGNQTFNTESQ